MLSASAYIFGTRFNLGYCMVEDDDVLGRMEQLDGQAALDAFTGMLSGLDLGT